MFYSGRNGIFHHDKETKVQPHNPQIIRKAVIIKPQEAEKKDAPPPVTAESSVATMSTWTTAATQVVDKPSVAAERNFTNILKFNMKSDRNADFKRVARKVIKTIVIEHGQDQWKREEHGGVKMWVNSSTGEVSVEDPHKRDVSKHRRGSLSSIRSNHSKVAPMNMNGTIRQGHHHRGSVRDNGRSSVRQTQNIENEEMKDWFEGFLDSNSLKIKKAIRK